MEYALGIVLDILDTIYYGVVIFGEVLWILYLCSDKNRYYRAAHFMIMIGMSSAFLCISAQCFLLGEVPWYAIFILGLPAAFGSISEGILLFNKKWLFCKGIILLNCVIQISIGLYCLVDFYICFDNILSVLFYTGKSLLFCSITKEFLHRQTNKQ